MAKQEEGQQKPKTTTLPQVDKTKIEKFTKGGALKTKNDTHNKV
jgi:hypothetical protein